MLEAYQFAIAYLVLLSISRIILDNWVVSDLLFPLLYNYWDFWCDLIILCTVNFAGLVEINYSLFSACSFSNASGRTASFRFWVKQAVLIYKCLIFYKVLRVSPAPSPAMWEVQFWWSVGGQPCVFIKYKRLSNLLWWFWEIWNRMVIFMMVFSVQEMSLCPEQQSGRRSCERGHRGTSLLCPSEDTGTVLDLRLLICLHVLGPDCI